MPRFAASDGVTLHYDDDGSGLPVLCLPGLTRNGADFDHVAPQLSAHRMIRLDSRGRGKSDWADPATYTIPVEAMDVLALLDHLALDEVAILGTSRGGLIAMSLAAMAKHRLLGICLNDIGPVIDQKGLDTIAGYIGKPPPYPSLDLAARTRAETWRAFENVSLDRWLAEVTAHYEETPDGLVLRYDPALADAFQAGASAADLPDLWPLFDAMDGLPLALIRGVNSDLTSKATASEMARRRPDMIWAEVPGRGHVPFLDEPEAEVAIAAWLERLS